MFQVTTLFVLLIVSPFFSFGQQENNQKSVNSYVSNRYRFESLNEKQEFDGYVIIDFDSTRISIVQEGDFYFEHQVEKIVLRRHNGKMYSLFVLNNYATLSVKWNALKQEYYFEYESGTNPQDGFRYTFYDTVLNTDD